MISERSKLGIAVARANGKRIGRQVGEVVYYVKLRKYEKELMTAYKNGASINSLAKKYHVKWTTVKMFITKFSKVKKPRALIKKPKKHGHPTYRELEYFEKHEIKSEK